MSAPRHSAAVPGVCAAGLAGALPDAHVPEGGHRPRQRRAPNAEQGQDALKQHPGPAVGPPRPGPVPVPPRLGSLIPRGRYSAQEGSAQSDAWRDDAGQ